MRSFADLDVAVGMVPFDVVRALRSIDTGRGSELLYRDKLPGLLTELADRARVSSITASSAIEGVVVQDANRSKKIIEGNTVTLRTRSEQELAGYRLALDYLYQEQWQPLNVGLIMHLHRLLFSKTQAPGGSLKTADNLVIDRLPDGRNVERFQPVAAAQTEYYLAELVERYNLAITDEKHHPVILIALFVLDLLIIHPFADGNGRVARVLTNALLDESGYGVTRYVSVEQAIADDANTYYSKLLESTHGRQDERSDPWPWIRYFTGLTAGAYKTFSLRATSERSSGTKQKRVRVYVLEHADEIFRIADIRTALPGVSDPTIRLALEDLKREGLATPEGTGRGAVWRRSSGH